MEGGLLVMDCVLWSRWINGSGGLGGWGGFEGKGWKEGEGNRLE